MGKTKNFSIIIPAYNEEKLIARKLLQLASSLPSGCTEVITVCNGCTDQTYPIAQTTINSVLQETRGRCNFILHQLVYGSKINALNEGVKISKNKTVILLDADIDIPSSELTTLVELLNKQSVMAMSPSAVFKFDNANWLVKKFYAVLSQSSYNTQHRISNVIALSPEAINMLFPLPHIIADDAYIQRTVKNYHVTNKLSYNFTCPTTLTSTLKVQSRIIRGNLQLKKTYPNLTAPKSVLPKLSFSQHIIFLSIKAVSLIIAYIELKLKINTWHQDETSRK